MTNAKTAAGKEISQSLSSFPPLSAVLLTQSIIGHALNVRTAIMNISSLPGRICLNTLPAPKRPPAPQAKPASCAALNMAYSAMTGLHGRPTATTPTPAPASAMAAARLKRETATAALRTAAHTALAPFAAERTSMPIILFLRAGTGALTRT